MRTIFCGTGPIGLPALAALAESGKHKPCAVFTQPDNPAGRGLHPRPSAIKQFALEKNIPLFQPEKIRSPEALETLRQLAPDLMVVAAYGQLLPPAVLGLPRLGCINLHASLLPRHRGASPINAAILAGDQETGITVMYMDAGLDTGDILLADSLPISPEDTAGTLHDKLATLAAPSLLRALELLETGQAPRTPQDPAPATHAPKLKKTDGLLDWNEPAEALARRVRALSPWPGAFTHLGGQSLKIHKARAVAGQGEPGTVLSATDEGIAIAAKSGCLLLIELQLEGRKRLPASEFLRGHPLPPGKKLV
jgi:methionyl-tRNA formyltransferase